jgi:FkbM family methyltransferase
VISQIHRQDVVAHKIHVETLDDIAQREGVQCIDFLKIDAEGNEFSVPRFLLIKTYCRSQRIAAISESAAALKAAEHPAACSRVSRSDS